MVSLVIGLRLCVWCVAPVCVRVAFSSRLGMSGMYAVRHCVCRFRGNHILLRYFLQRFCRAAQSIRVGRLWTYSLHSLSNWIGYSIL